jgi:hypothetical protein
MPESPCIDAGTNDPVGGLPPEDADGNLRPLDGNGDTIAIADMGAYEFNPAVPSIALSPERLDLTIPEGEDDPVTQMLSLRNAGGGTLQWTITGAPEWLTLSRTSGASSGEVDAVLVHARAEGLGFGTYHARLEVSDPQAVNSPRVVFVKLTVTTTVYVPGDYATIQAAIDAVPAGNIVELDDGVYSGAGNKNVRFGGKPLTLRSASGDPALCVIDCEGDGCGLIFEANERLDTKIEGLTIRNGTGYDPWSTGVADGGGVYCYEASPTFVDCVFENNEVGGDGGGVYCDFTYTRFVRCVFQRNTAGYEAGGLHVLVGNVNTTDCVFRENEASGGGGLFCQRDYPTILRCTITGNSAEVGGGISCHACSPLLRDCTISGNTASRRGGGGHHEDFRRHALHVNCLFTGNSAGDFGGAAYCGWDTAPTFSNCTFTRNTAGESGGSVFAIYDARPAVRNCVFRDNAPQAIAVDDADAVVTYSNIEGGWPGEGNIDADPLFAAGPGGCFYLSQTAAGQPFDSPCVDTGSDTAANLGLDAMTTRRDEVTDSGTVDMGYHYPVSGEPYLPGDINGDGVIDLIDYAEFGSAMTGPGPLPPGTVTGCLTAADLDDDGDLDTTDFAAFQILLGQPPFMN